ncbi:RIP metalloprotease RseP [Lactobacillus taiwanensis]|uniref:RIP metalloprotease RseP n=2 Tax=Lactobacillus taiwanensis TaxID=508451 RepID=UPI000B98FCD9|nr:RIP metalloprotease RseP [Lactobacillus taiwanensis]MCR1916624.1 RIP metalloprotease RseP [Lactobacillus taiwanensis]OYS20793.1 RIP metalloprotease RseP [Lactobacillus taiwanensis]OYS23377.1 RIP metalloprotease RseP [Lactobacillus taiwanensis]OYS24849.1 RIP metalloprotease RseP [Lactobacillus taiwanensis]OYS26873.1 RIP metalloprotease RseP [Lactobacillus taiwanensis]
MKGILIFLVVFGILVFVHEFGHFIVAKKCGILVREFSIGMGPKLFQKMRAKTTYTIRWLPLGGYVRLAGPDDAAKIDPGTTVVLQLDKHNKVKRIDASGSQMPIEGVPVQVNSADLVDDLVIQGYENGDEDQLKMYHVDHDATIIEQNGTELLIAPRNTQFQEASVGKKLATNFAGPFMNIVLGFVVFIIWSLVVPGAPTTTVGSTIANQPAQVAGIKANDQIIAINNKKINNFNQIAVELAKSNGKKVEVIVKRNNKTKDFSVKPKAKKIDGQKIYQLGFYGKPDNSLGAKLQRGWTTSVNTTALIFNAVGNLFKHFSLNKLSGPVGIYSQTVQVSNMGFTYLLAFLAMISINLGIVNLIPIPGLDGGKLLLNLVQLIIGRPIPEDKEAIVDVIGVVILLALIIAVTGNDIYRYFIK